MSYDLDLFKPQKDVAAITTIQQAALERHSAQHERNHQIVKVLEKDNPQFHLQQTQTAIDLVEHQYGLKISLYHHGGHIGIPYWNSDEQAIQYLFWTARRYLRLIQKASGYAIYDPQLGRVVDMRQDISAMIAAYNRALSNMYSFYSNL